MNLNFILPEIILCISGIIVLVLDLIISKKRILGYISVIGLLITLFATFDRFWPVPQTSFFGMFISDGLSHFFKCLVIIGAILITFISIDFSGIRELRKGTFFALLQFACLAMMFLASSNDLIMIFLTIEFLSIASYILVGFSRTDLRSSEAAVKYFLIGAFSSGFLLYGMTLIYGLTKTTNLIGIANWYSTHDFSALLNLGVIFVLVGFGFKIAIVPFHMWVPDVYEGAPTPITAFLAGVSKAIGVMVLLRVFLHNLPSPEPVIAILCAITMTIGNLMAIPQKNIKRLLAYSSIGHIGYIMIGFVVGNKIGTHAILIYLLSYLFMVIGSFAVVIAVYNKTKSDEIEDYAGLSETSPVFAYLLLFFFLSLVGIPPTAGFVAKFYIFAGAIQNDYLWLAIVGILNSVISLYYYFRVVHQMFFVTSKQRFVFEKSFALRFAVLISAIFVLLIGIYPQIFFDLISISY